MSIFRFHFLLLSTCWFGSSCCGLLPGDVFQQALSWVVAFLLVFLNDNSILPTKKKRERGNVIWQTFFLFNKRERERESPHSINETLIWHTFFYFLIRVLKGRVQKYQFPFRNWKPWENLKSLGTIAQFILNYGKFSDDSSLSSYQDTNWFFGVGGKSNLRSLIQK